MTSLKRAVFTFFFLCLAASFSRAEIKPAIGRDLLPAHVFNSIQNYMLEKRFDGWLFSGQGSFDDIEKDFLGLKGKTRYRWFIFIPGLAGGELFVVFFAALLIAVPITRVVNLVLVRLRLVSVVPERKREKEPLT